MLSAAVAGPVFTSPPPHSILAAINAISTPQSGILVYIAFSVTPEPYVSLC